MIARRRKHFRRINLFGFLASLLSISCHASDALDKAGGLIWGMSEIYTDLGHHRMARGMTPDKLKNLAAKAAGKLASRRDDLAAVLRDLDPESGFAQELKRFLEAWPDRLAIRDELLRDDEGEELGRALAGLARQVPDTRWRWKTPFPFFRP